MITTTNGIFESTASITAAFANLGGTKTTDAFAPVAAMASATVSNTGNDLPSISTFWPPLPGVTPPTILVPDFNILAVCLVPSEPVMP